MFCAAIQMVSHLLRPCGSSFATAHDPPPRRRARRGWQGELTEPIIPAMSKASDLETLAKSFLDLWQDQFAAAAADPANAEAMARLFGAMAAGQPTQVGPVEGSDEQTSNNDAVSTGGASGGAAGPAPAGAPSGNSGDGVSELAERLGALEERLGKLERKLERAGGKARAKPGKRKS